MTRADDDALPIKVSVNMIPRAYAAVEYTAGMSGDSRTDVINRAVQLYAFVEKVRADGGRLLIQDADRNIRPLEID